MPGVDPSATFNAETQVYEVPLDNFKGKKFVCSCGQSKKLPFCDGTHANLGIKPVQIQINTDTNQVEIRSRQEVANELAKKEYDANFKKRTLITLGTLIGGFAALTLLTKSK